MKIVIPITGFGRAGGFRVLSNLANEWIKSGHTVQFLCPRESDDPYFPTIAEIIWFDRKGAKVPTDERGVNHRPARLWNVLGSLKVALKQHANDADVVLANQSMTAWPIFFTRLKTRKFYYIQAYEPEYYSLLPGTQMPIMRALSFVSYMLPLTHIVNAPIYLGYKSLRARTWVPPGIDFELFSPDQKRDSPRTKTIIGCVGRMEVYKGTKYVLDAYHILKQRDVDVELRVAFGNISDKGLDSGVKVITPQGDKELGDFYRSLDILIASGTVQLGAAHYPVMEAMACGTTVITTGYLPANAHNSWLVPTHDANAIADAVVEIVSNTAEQERRTMQATKDIQRFTWASAASSMLRDFSAA